MMMVMNMLVMNDGGVDFTGDNDDNASPITMGQGGRRSSQSFIY